MVVPEVFLFNLYFAAWISYWTWISSSFFKLCLYPSCVCVFFAWIFFLLLFCYYSPISLLNIFCFSKCTMIFCAEQLSKRFSSFKLS